MISVRQIRYFACLLPLWALLGPQCLPGAQPRATGREIFRQQCAKCHGRNGEGVKGKYDSDLHGDWALEKLTRYIDKNMPDDAPEKCVGPDAEAVARYIYDAFYSREARARNHPARVELVRLTNRQYVNTVADLIGHFTGSDHPTGDEHGLRGNELSQATQERDVIRRNLDQANLEKETARQSLIQISQERDTYRANYEKMVREEQTLQAEVSQLEKYNTLLQQQINLLRGKTQA